MSESTVEKKPEIFIPPELPPPKARDEVLSGSEFMAISVFANIKDSKKLERALDQRAAILRYYAPGETIVVQGDAGETAFYVLNDEDVTTLRQAQIEAIDKVWAFLADPDPPAPKKGQDPREHRLAFFTPEQQERLREYYEHEIEQLEARAGTAEEDAPPASAWLMAQASRETGEQVSRRARSFAQKLFGFFKKTKRKNAPRSISIDAATDIDPNTMRGDIASGEIFGEMSCLHRSPRSATIVANRPCYMVEMLRNVLDQLHLDTAFRARMRDKYVERALGGQLRRLPIFRTMTDEQFEWLLDREHNRIEWTEFETGDVLFEEGEDSDALYIVHKGLVKVLQHVRARLLPEDLADPDWAKLSAALNEMIVEVDAARESRKQAEEAAAVKAAEAAKKAAEEAAKAGDDAKKKPNPAAKKKVAALPWREMLRESVVDHVRGALENRSARAAAPPSEEDDFADAPVTTRTAEDLLNAGDAEARAAVLDGLNAFIVDEANLVGSRRHPFDKRRKDPPDPRWTTIKRILEDVQDPQLPTIFAHSSNSTEDWSQLEIRLFQRRMLELALPGIVPERIGTGERRRVLAYLGPGQILGEMGVMQEIVEGPGTGARNATCIAYDHPDRPTDDIKAPDANKGAITRVELLTIRKHVFAALMEACPPLEEHVGETIQRRQLAAAPRKQAAQGRTASTLPTMESQRFEDLGLVQGQHLMLIDLDRCTRCNACVDACISAHDDGHTRLYLDGPQFQSYLVPVTCRSCLDPVCMIGCPVGSINRGNKGEILIEPWCIGCRLCANQCPYGSIQMESIRESDEQRIKQHAQSVFGELGEDIAQFDVKMPKLQAVVCDLCSSSTSPGPACVHACPHEAALRVHALSTFTTST